METARQSATHRSAAHFREHYRRVRQQSEDFCAPLATEDYVPQPVEEVSPPKWHLAHTTWFFENFLLVPEWPGYRLYNEQYNYLFNSYYESMGERVLRPRRGDMTRPTVQEIYCYRRHVDQSVLAWLESGEPAPEALAILELGLHHEQQHQELLVTDTKYILGHNPLFPAYKEQPEPPPGDPGQPRMQEMPDGVYEIGYGGDAFCYDNELGHHKVFLHAFAAANRPVTNAEYLEFIQQGGYRDHRFWYSDAWSWLQEQAIEAPLYWHLVDGQWMQYTLAGLRPLLPEAPVVHVSHYEAAAYAQWRGKRLLTEQEWEALAQRHAPEPPENANLAESGSLHPRPRSGDNLQLWGDVWEWTDSAYLPYPFYKAPEGALGEYNGKFMINQMVLRGGSCATPLSHMRLSYRNFFQPWHRWQFSGIRLGETL